MRGGCSRVLKRALLIALSLVTLGAALAEGPLCLVEEKLVMLVSESGDVLLEGGGIEDVFTVREGALYAAGRRGEYRLYDAAGSAVGETTFDMIADEEDGLIFRIGGRYGAMDEAGNVVLPAEYTQLTGDGAGGWLALDTDPLDETPDALLHIDRDGKARACGVTTTVGISHVRCDRMPVMAVNGRFGAVNGRGELIIPTQWRSMGPFIDGVSKVAGEDGLGLIDADGQTVVPATFDWLERGESLIAAKDAGGVSVFSPDGRDLLCRVLGSDLEVCLVGDCLLVRDGEAARLYAADGGLIGAFDPDFRCSAGLGGQLIGTVGAWGEAGTWLMERDGSPVSGRYQRLLPLAGGRYAFIVMRGTEYFSADLNRVQTSWDYDSLRCGLLSAAGEELLPAEYKEIRVLSEDRLLLVDEAGITIADLDGNVVRRWETTEAAAPTGEGAS